MRKFAVLLSIPFLIAACERHPVSHLHKLEGGLVNGHKEDAGHSTAKESPAASDKAAGHH